MTNVIFISRLKRIFPWIQSEEDLPPGNNTKLLLVALPTTDGPTPPLTFLIKFCSMLQRIWNHWNYLRSMKRIANNSCHLNISWFYSIPIRWFIMKDMSQEKLFNLFYFPHFLISSISFGNFLPREHRSTTVVSFFSHQLANRFQWKRSCRTRRQCVPQILNASNKSILWQQKKSHVKHIF